MGRLIPCAAFSDLMVLLPHILKHSNHKSYSLCQKNNLLTNYNLQMKRYKYLVYTSVKISRVLSEKTSESMKCLYPSTSVSVKCLYPGTSESVKCSPCTSVSGRGLSASTSSESVRRLSCRANEPTPKWGLLHRLSISNRWFQSVTARQFRRISTSCSFNDIKDDEILKDDPYIRDLLKEIRQDLSPNSGSKIPKTNEDIKNKTQTLNTTSERSVRSDRKFDEEDMSSSDSDSESSSDEEEKSSLVQDKNQKSSTKTESAHSQEVTSKELDLEVGGFISLTHPDDEKEIEEFQGSTPGEDLDSEEIEEFPDEFEPDFIPIWKSPISLERGVEGVYDVEELVELLKSDNAKDICVIRLPVHLSFGCHMVVVTARSYRQMKAITKNVKRIYKQKRRPSDRFPVVSGEEEGDWVAFDLGNIILHVFKKEVREMYDLETLWTVGPEFDEKSTQSHSPFILELSDMEWLQNLGNEQLEQKS